MVAAVVSPSHVVTCAHKHAFARAVSRQVPSSVRWWPCWRPPPHHHAPRRHLEQHELHVGRHARAAQRVVEGGAHQPRHVRAVLVVRGAGCWAGVVHTMLRGKAKRARQSPLVPQGGDGCTLCEGRSTASHRAPVVRLRLAVEPKPLVVVHKPCARLARRSTVGSLVPTRVPAACLASAAGACA